MAFATLWYALLWFAWLHLAWLGLIRRYFLFGAIEGHWLCNTVAHTVAKANEWKWSAFTAIKWWISEMCTLYGTFCNQNILKIGGRFLAFQNRQILWNPTDGSFRKPMCAIRSFIYLFIHACDGFEEPVCVCVSVGWMHLSCALAFASLWHSKTSLDEFQIKYEQILY